MSLRFKRHHKLMVLLALVVAVLIAGAGDERMVAYSVQSTGQAAGPVVTYSHTLAVVGNTVGETVQVSGAVPGSGAATTQ